MSMEFQRLPDGKTFILYGSAVEYQSPILIDENYPSIVTYKCAKSKQLIGKVYKTANGKWWLATCFLQHWQPVEVFSKIEGFLFLNSLYKQNVR